MKLATFACVVLLSFTASTACAQAPTAPVAATDRSVEDLFKAAQNLEGQNNFREAESYYEKIVREIEKEKVKNFPALYRAYNGLGNADLKLKDMPGADLNYREALSAAVKVYGAGSYDLTKPLINLARVFYQEKKYFDSATYFKQALALVERKSGIEDPEAVSIREKLAETLERSGSYKESEVLLKQSLALREKNGDHSSPQLLALLNCYSDVLHKTDRVSEAEQIDYQVDQIHAGKIPASSTTSAK
ncbi:MAG: tetratricopeptide repeat protein [Candidatus Melainabacteria bacterium]|nr:tetratricopeptide repeat protein [Candidatus Melainabacteria bacterium]